MGVVFVMCVPVDLFHMCFFIDSSLCNIFISFVFIFFSLCVFVHFFYFQVHFYVFYVQFYLLVSLICDLFLHICIVFAYNPNGILRNRVFWFGKTRVLIGRFGTTMILYCSFIFSAMLIDSNKTIKI